MVLVQREKGCHTSFEAGNGSRHLDAPGYQFRQTWERKEQNKSQDGGGQVEAL